jgi:hypothetical protein
MTDEPPTFDRSAVPNGYTTRYDAKKGERCPVVDDVYRLGCLVPVNHKGGHYAGTFELLEDFPGLIVEPRR